MFSRNPYKSILGNANRVFAGNQFQYENVGGEFSFTTVAIPASCPSCGPNGTVIYAGLNCYCSCHNDCGNFYLDPRDCSCNPCLGKTKEYLVNTSCSDNNNCTANDYCSNGVCNSGTYICGGELKIDFIRFNKKMSVRVLCVKIESVIM
jgi:hypothetical protein